MEHALPLSRILTIVMQIYASTAMSAIFSAHFVTPELCPQVPLRQPSSLSHIAELHRQGCLRGKAAWRKGSPQPLSPTAPAARPMTTPDEVLPGFSPPCSPHQQAALALRGGRFMMNAVLATLPAPNQTPKAIQSSKEF